MKKQILLVLVAMCVMGISAVYAQFVPRQITCLNPDALHPLPGTPYTYEVTVPTPPGVKSYLWFVTQDVNFITNGALTSNREAIGGNILAAGSGHYNAHTVNANSISLTWQSFVYNPANPVFVVIEVTNAETCVTQNMKVYRIEPLHAFSLDITNVLNGVPQPGYGQNIDMCVSDIRSATYDPVNDAVIYDFGADTMYFAVVSANWSGAWQLRVSLAGLQPGQSATIDWGYTLGNYNNNVVTGATADGNWASATLVTPQGGSFVGQAGEFLYIRLILNHGSQFENIVAHQYTLAVNGQLHDGTGLIPNYYDVHHTAGPQNECPWMANFDDIAYQTLKPRPDIQAVSPTPLLPIAP